MSETGFDALKVANDLEAAGMENGQAQAVAKAVQDARADLVTKADLDAGLATVRTGTDGRFAKLEGQMDVRFAKLEGQMDAGFAKVEALLAKQAESFYKWMWVMGGSIIGIMLSTTIVAFRIAVDLFA